MEILLLFLLVLMIMIDIHQLCTNPFIDTICSTRKCQKIRDRIYYRQHRKDCKDMKKEFMEYINNKSFGPWDNYIVDFLDIQIKYWIKYYSLGYNVCGMEIKEGKKQGYYPFVTEDIPTRLEIAKQLQTLLYRYTHFLDKDYEKCKKELFDYYYKYAVYMWD